MPGLTLKETGVTALDLSLRSAGVVRLGAGGRMQNCMVIAINKNEADDEHLLLAIESRVLEFARVAGSSNDRFVIEGLAFMGTSGRRDLIDGNWWNLKKELRQAYPHALIDVVPVTKWRASVLSKEEQREAKAASKTEGLKRACVAKLPGDVHGAFTRYLADNGHPQKAIYDLTDAYWLARYTHNLLPQSEKTH